jgi:hypothetical protein
MVDFITPEEREKKKRWRKREKDGVRRSIKKSNNVELINEEGP